MLRKIRSYLLSLSLRPTAVRRHASSGRIVERVLVGLVSPPGENPKKRATISSKSNILNLPVFDEQRGPRTEI